MTLELRVPGLQTGTDSRMEGDVNGVRDLVRPVAFRDR
jgi:hypothetical protein